MAPDAPCMDVSWTAGFDTPSAGCGNEAFVIMEGCAVVADPKPLPPPSPLELVRETNAQVAAALARSAACGATIGKAGDVHPSGSIPKSNTPPAARARAA